MRALHINREMTDRPKTVRVPDSISFAYDNEEPVYDVSSAAFSAQYLTTMERLQAWARSNTYIAPKVLEDCFSLYNKNFLGQSFGNLEAQNYSDLKLFFEKILYWLEHSTKPLAQKQAIYKNMLRQFSVCPAGMYISMSKVQQELSDISSVENCLAKMREDMVYQIAGQYIGQNVRFAEGMAVHVHNAFSIAAGVCGFVPSGMDQGRIVNDVYAQDFLASYGRQVFNLLKTRFSEEYTFEAIVNAIAVYLSEHVSDKIKSVAGDEQFMQSGDLRYAGLADALQLKLNIISAQMGVSDEVKPIPLHVIFDLISDDEDDWVSFRNKADFYQRIRPYILNFLLKNHYILTDEQLSVRFELEDGNVIVLNQFQIANSWVIKKTEDGVLEPIETYINNVRLSNGVRSSALELFLSSYDKVDQARRQIGAINTAIDCQKNKCQIINHQKKKLELSLTPSKSPIVSLFNRMADLFQEGLSAFFVASPNLLIDITPALSFFSKIIASFFTALFSIFIPGSLFCFLVDVIKLRRFLISSKADLERLPVLDEQKKSAIANEDRVIQEQMNLLRQYGKSFDYATEESVMPEGATVTDPALEVVKVDAPASPVSRVAKQDALPLLPVPSLKTSLRSTLFSQSDCHASAFTHIPPEILTPL